MVDGTPIDMMAHPLQADGSPVFVLDSCSLDSIAGDRWSMTTTYDGRWMMNDRGWMMYDEWWAIGIELIRSQRADDTITIAMKQLYDYIHGWHCIALYF
jgi:hypothetical protein